MTPSFTQTVLAFVREHKLLPIGAHVLCAISGGADSVALLSFLVEQRDALGLSSVTAAHFHHGLRGADADEDARFVEALCKTFGVVLTQGSADVAATAKARGAGIEEAARALRYAFLTEQADALGCTQIALGHHLGDQLETVLLHLVRGAGLRGLCGMPPGRGRLIRPFLCVRREEIESYLTERNLSFHSDHTNNDPRFARNRLRQHVVPELLALNPRLLDTVSGMTRHLQEDEAYLTAEADRALRDLRQTPEGLALPLTDITALPPPLQTRACRSLFARAWLGQNREGTSMPLFPVPPLGEAKITEMRRVLSGGPHAACRLPGGLTLRRVYDTLVLGPAPEESTRCVETALVPDTPLSLPALGLQLSISYHDTAPNTILSATQATHTTPLATVFSLAANAVTGPLRLRPRKPGDRLRLPGRPGSRSLKRLMIDRKIPLHKRDSLPVLTDDTDRVLAALGFGVDDSARARPGEAVWVVKFEAFG